MDLSRRDFLKATGIGGISLALSSLGFDLKEAKAAAHTFKLEGAREFTSICHFCACGCGVIGYVKDGKLINLEGATDSPINRGALCSKGLGYAVIPNSKERATKPLYRAPGSDHWEEISWDEAIDRAAKAMKNAREKGWKQTEEIDGETYEVRRTDGLSFIGGSQINNEECYQNIKMARALGVVYIDNQTRVCHANTPPAMGAAFGRGAMTNPWGDLKNTKLVWIEGSNLAECHPMGLKNVMKAREQNGTKIVHVDVRYTRTSKIADEFFQLRPGTDIAFMGYIISQMLEREKFNKDYVLRNTNAACLLRDDFSFQDGLFSGFDEAKKSYTNKESWGYALGADGKPQKANDLFAPNTVLSRLKEFYSRYTVEMVSNVTGMPAEDIQRAADIWVNHEGPAIIMYALGMTQHTVGVQNIRCFTIMQLLKGNIGIPGGGIIAMRGQPNVQASTDFGIEFNMQPGYLVAPTHKTNTLAKWTDAFGTFRRKWYVNMTKAWFGEHATAENDYGFNYGAIRNGNHPDSIYAIFEDAWRRHHRHARAAKRPGFDRLRHRVQHAAGLPRCADAQDEHAREVDGCLRHVPPQVVRQHDEGMVRRARDGRERLRLQLRCHPQRQPSGLHLRDLRGRLARHDACALPLRPEPACHERQRRPRPRRPLQDGFPRRAGYLRQ